MSLEIRDLKKRYVAPDGSVVPVIDVPALDVADGRHVAMIGSSGSGKTTLLHLIAGIVSADSGHIVFKKPGGASTDITRLGEPQRDVFRGANIGYIFQTHHLLPGFSAIENVQLGMSFTGRKADRAWAKRLLTEVGLGDRLDFRPGKLSVGQQQRVAVARALANRPGLVLADEPTGALDPANAQAVLELIRTLCREVGAALLLVTHDLSIANQLESVITLSDVNRSSRPQAAA